MIERRIGSLLAILALASVLTGVGCSAASGGAPTEEEAMKARDASMNVDPAATPPPNTGGSKP